MKTTRRAFLATTTVAFLLPKVSVAQEYQILRATTGKQHIGPEGFPDTEIWGYNGSVAGPTIRVKQGGTLAFV